jgi:hypothetical protein
MATTGNVFAYNRNQATASTNDCENGQMATNVGCQNIGSQIQGDGNSVALAAQQTFPASEPTPPPPSTGFTVIGSGSTTGASVECTPSVPADLEIFIEFSAQSNGDVTETSLAPYKRGILQMELQMETRFP